jgi:hypothetical protein
MAAQVLQTVDPAHPSLDPDPQPGPSRTATVADEADEVAAEAGVALTNGTNGTNGANGSAVKVEDIKQDGDEEEEEDPDAIPRNACETLYIQNLNEKVQIPGECAERFAWAGESGREEGGRMPAGVVGVERLLEAEGCRPMLRLGLTRRCRECRRLTMDQRQPQPGAIDSTCRTVRVAHASHDGNAGIALQAIPPHPAHNSTP